MLIWSSDLQQRLQSNSIANGKSIQIFFTFFIFFFAKKEATDIEKKLTLTPTT